MKLLHILLAGSIFLLSCSSGENAPDTPAGPAVYAVGLETINGINVAKYWKNGVGTNLSSGLTHANAGSVFVTPNDDVYICGQVEENGYLIAKYWKNGVPVTLGQNAYCSKIFVANDDVYVAGATNGSGSNYSRAKYWKNGVEVNLTDGSQPSAATSIYVSGNDVYVCGSVSDPNTDIVTLVYWKNGVPTILPSSGGLFTNLEDIFVSGNDVYVLGCDGFTNPPTHIQTLKYWKNGSEVILPTASNSAYPFAFAVAGTDVYVAGVDVVGGKSVATVWKNGVATNISTTYSSAFDIAVLNNDVYVSGVERSGTVNKAKCWKNGVELLPLESGAESSQAEAIFIK
jgi:hypothetical protein